MMVSGYGIQDTLLMLIAVSSFGERLRRIEPYGPGGGLFKEIVSFFSRMRQVVSR